MATTYLYLDRNSYDANVSMCGNVQNTNSVGAFDNTTYATLEYSDQVGNQNFTWWKFNSSTLNIPSGSTITNVSCDFKCAGDFANMGTGPGIMQLYYGNNDNYPKGETVDFTQNDYSTFTVTQITNGGDWTISELNNVYLKVLGEIPQGITTLHFYGATLTIEYTEPIDYEIGTGAWYSKIGGAWKEIYKMYYKVGNAWKEVAYAYRKQDNTWYSIGERKLLFEADFYNSLAYIDYLGNTTGNFSYDGTASYTNSMLNINNRGDNFKVSTAIPSSLKTYLINPNNEVWFTIKAHVISWNDTGWRGGNDNGWATNSLWVRNGNIFNTFSINGPNYAGSASEPYVPNNTVVWVKSHYYGNNYDEYFYSSSTWSPQHPTANVWNQIFGRSGSTSTLAYNANDLNYVGFGKGYINYRISDFKIWSSEPTNAEIGI